MKQEHKVVIKLIHLNNNNDDWFLHSTFDKHLIFSLADGVPDRRHVHGLD